MWKIFLSKIKSGLENFVPKRTRQISYVRVKVTYHAHILRLCAKKKKVMSKEVFKRSFILLLSTQ